METTSTLWMKKMKTTVIHKLSSLNRFLHLKQTFYQMRLSIESHQLLVPHRTRRSSKLLKTFWSIWTTNTRRRNKKTLHNLIILEPVCKVNSKIHRKQEKIMDKIGLTGTLSTNLEKVVNGTLNKLMMKKLIWMIFSSNFMELTFYQAMK